MTDEPDRLFERFRQKGDSAALGRVFDATAPKLLELAVHLVGDIAAAEDLVQATFVTAIERAATFDASRSLDAWLAGILANHARDLRKAARREIDVTALVERIESTPLEHALQTEWSSALAQALDGVPEPYRVVLILRLQHGMTPTEIAHALQRSPGAVRVQLHRGREMLRRLLPAGIVASALFIAEPGRGLAQIKANVIAKAALVKSSVGVMSIAGGLLVSTKIVVGSIAIVLALLAMFLVRQRTQEPTTTMFAESPREVRTSSASREHEVEASGDLGEGTHRADAAPARDSDATKKLMLHGRVFDSETNEGIANAEVMLFPPVSTPLSEVLRKWSDRLNVHAIGDGYPGGGEAIGWPRFGAKLEDEAFFEADGLVVYAPPAAGEIPIAHAVTGPTGEFEVAAPESLGFLTCKASGYALRQKAVTPAETNAADSGRVSIRVAMCAPRTLSGYVVDENMKPIERRVRIAFGGHINRPTPISISNDGKVSGELDQDQQMDQWIVETKPDGSYTCDLPAKMVLARSLEPDLGFVKEGFLREGGTKWVHEVWPEPGAVKEPLLIVLKPVCSLIVRDRDTHAPIEGIHLYCTRFSDGLLLRLGRFFAPGGRLRLAREMASWSAAKQLEEENSTCECTVWADGYLPSTLKLEGLTAAHVAEFDLERGEMPVLSGRVHKAERAIEAARISISKPDWYGNWGQHLGHALAGTKSDSVGAFRIQMPGGRYVMTVETEGDKESRIVELPLDAPVDVDLSIKTSIVAEVRDSSGAVCPDHPVILRAADGRVMRAQSDSKGSAMFERLPAGTHVLQVKNAKDARSPKPDQEISVSVSTGEEKRVDVSIPVSAPRSARLVVDGVATFARWKACDRVDVGITWQKIEADGRIPIDIRGLAYLRIADPETREWTALIPTDAPDGYEIRLALDGRGYEGILTSQSTGRSLTGVRVIATPWNAPKGTAIVVTGQSDVNGHYELTGLVDDDYSLAFEGRSESDNLDNVYVRPTARPSTPLTPLSVTLPKNMAFLTGSGPQGFEGHPSIVLTGVVRKRSGTLPRINGYIGSVIERAGYTLTLYTYFSVAPDGSYETRVPSATKFVASLRRAETGESYSQAEWVAQGAGDREEHDIDLP